MTIGQSLLGHGMGVEAAKAFQLALEIATRHFGKESIEVVTVTVKLIETYTQNSHYEQTLSFIDPYIDKVLTLEFEHVQYAKMFVVFNKVNSRFFVDGYKDVRKEPAVKTLKRISKVFATELSPLDLIDINLSIIKYTFYRFIGDYASPTAQVNESTVKQRVNVLKKLIPDVDRLINLARDNKNTLFLLPDLLAWKARFSYETKNYIAVDVAFSESLQLAKLFFEDSDNRLSNTYLIGAAMYRFLDTEKAVFYVRQSTVADNKAHNYDSQEYLDSMPVLQDFLYLNGEFREAKASMKKANDLIDVIGVDNRSQENIESYWNIYETYIVNHLIYDSTNTSGNYSVFVNDSLSGYHRVRKDRRSIAFSDILDYIDITNDGALILKKLVHNLEQPYISNLKDIDILLIVMNKLVYLKLYKAAASLIPIFNKYTDWSDLEKNKSMQYASFKTLLGDIYYNTSDFIMAKEEYTHAESIFLNHYREDSGHSAIIYLGLAEIAYIEKEPEVAKAYLQKAKISYETHFAESSRLGKRWVILTNQLKG